MQTLVAVTLGRAVAALPHRPVTAVAALLFLAGGVFLLVSARRADQDEAETEAEFEGKATRRHASPGCERWGPASWCCSSPSGVT